MLPANSRNKWHPTMGKNSASIPNAKQKKKNFFSFCLVHTVLDPSKPHSSTTTTLGKHQTGRSNDQNKFGLRFRSALSAERSFPAVVQPLAPTLPLSEAGRIECFSLDVDHYRGWIWFLDIACKGQRPETVLPLGQGEKYIICTDDSKGDEIVCPKTLFWSAETRRCERSKFFRVDGSPWIHPGYLCASRNTHQRECLCCSTMFERWSMHQDWILIPMPMRPRLHRQNLRIGRHRLPNPTTMRSSIRQLLPIVPRWCCSLTRLHSPWRTCLWCQCSTK